MKAVLYALAVVTVALGVLSAVTLDSGARGWLPVVIGASVAHASVFAALAEILRRVEILQWNLAAVGEQVGVEMESGDDEIEL